MSRSTMTLWLLVAGLGVVLTPGRASAQVTPRFGVQVDWGDDSDVGIGARISVPIAKKIPLEIQGSFDYFFPSSPATVDLKYWEINGNLVYLVPVKGVSVSPYVGSGLNLAHASIGTATVGGSDSQVGLNLLGGVAFPLKKSRIRPFAEARVELSGGEQVVLTGGIQF